MFDASGEIMRKIILLLFLFLILSACSGADGAILPTEVPPAPLPGPRDFATATPSLPPTWTPVPVPEGERIATGNGSPTRASTEGRVTYVVVAGDTLGEIATQFGVTVAELADENDISNWNVIEVGTVLVIPES